MKAFTFSHLMLPVLLIGCGALKAQPLLPNPVYGLRAAVAWDIRGTNGVPYGGTATVGFMEGVPGYYSWYHPATPVLLPWTQPGSTAVHCHDQVYKVAGSAANPNCRVELGLMRFMCHVIATGQWTDLTDEVIGGAAFVEDVYNNESTGGDLQSLANWVVSVRAGIGNAQPATSGGAGGTDSRGVGYLFHGFPADQPQLPLSSVDAILGFQQMRAVGPDAAGIHYICNVGLDYGGENGISGGRFVPATTNSHRITCYAGHTNLISTVPQPEVSYVPVTGVTMSAAVASIAGGASVQLAAKVSPTNASNPAVPISQSAERANSGRVPSSYGLQVGPAGRDALRSRPWATPVASRQPQQLN